MSSTSMKEKKSYFDMMKMVSECQKQNYISTVTSQPAFIMLKHKPPHIHTTFYTLYFAQENSFFLFILSFSDFSHPLHCIFHSMK